MSHCAVLLYCSFIFMFQLCLSLFHPLLLPFLSLFHFHFILSLSSLLILFFAPTFFLFYYSRSSFSRISRTDSLTTISLNSPPLSCLLDGSVYFERVVITPATIASLHCLLWSGDSVQSLRATQKGYPDSMETFARSKDRK